MFGSYGLLFPTLPFDFTVVTCRGYVPLPTPIIELTVWLWGEALPVFGREPALLLLYRVLILKPHVSSVGQGHGRGLRRSLQ